MYSEQINVAIKETKALFPVYATGKADPLEALRTGEANCAVRSFAVAVILESFGLRPLYSIHSYHAEKSRQDGVRYGHTHNVLGDVAIVSTADPGRIELSDYEEHAPWYIGATILGTAVDGLVTYVSMHPELPDLSLEYVERAKKGLLGRV